VAVAESEAAMTTIRFTEICAYLQTIAEQPAVSAASIRSAGLIDIRYAIDREGAMAMRFVSARHLDTAADLIASLSKRTDTYTGVLLRARRSGSRHAVSSSRLVFIEIDSPDAHQRLERFTHQPTLTVASGTPGHLHAYWRLRNLVSIDELEAANRRLAHHLGGDLACVDAGRILRPAGTMNYKHTPPAAVELLSLHPKPRYDLSELVAGLPTPPCKPPAPTMPRRLDRASLDGQLLAIPAEDYVHQLSGLRPTQAGKVRCPFHDDHTPSLHLYGDGTWACFGCRRGGTVYDFAAHLWDMPTKGRAFIELRKRVAHALGIGT
jgi:RepB DNA-primase from phage plasmid/CHC2 zinc finger